MEIKDKIKTFDAVKMMRDIRKKISLETHDMTFEQLKKYITEKTKKSKLKAIGR